MTINNQQWNVYQIDDDGHHEIRFAWPRWLVRTVSSDGASDPKPIGTKKGVAFFSRAAKMARAAHVPA